jgi:signal peptidase I
MKGYLLAIGIAAAVGVVAWSARWLVTRRLVLVTVRGASMEPTFADGERVLVSRRKPCHDGDVAVFGMPEWQRVDELRWLLKRVAGVPGQPVPADLRSFVAEDEVPPGFLVVRGDGAQSLDSRQLGLIPQASVLGVVIYPVRAAPVVRL